MTNSPLDNAHILVADSDPHMARVSMEILQRMGFKHVRCVSDGEEALRIIQNEQVDFLITGNQIPTVSRLELPTQSQDKQDKPLAAVPITMLLDTIEQHAEHDPQRKFLVTPNYIGPDRRSRAEPHAKERRKNPQRLNLQTLLAESTAGQLLPADASKAKKELSGNLFAVMDETQKRIPDLKKQAVHWLMKDIEELERVYHRLRSHRDSQTLEQFENMTLTIKSRAEIFGYRTSSNIASLLHQFLENDYQPDNKDHMIVLLKHVQSLKISIDAEHGNPDTVALLLSDLKTLARKFRRTPE